MDLADFTEMLTGISLDEMRRVAAALEAHQSAADEVDAWRATLGIDRALRRGRRTRVAARAASIASHAVLGAAAGHGVSLPDAQVTHVARAAAEVARGIVAGPEAAGELRLLLADWSSLVGVAA